LHVLKRWAAWPQGARWLVRAIVAVVLVLAIAWVLFVPVADWLAHHDVGTATGSLHETALDNARDRLLTLGAGLFAAGALLFTALNFNLLRRNSEKADQWQRHSYELTEQGQVTDRYTKAIEQLGSATVDVTIGGIYALERIAYDSPRDQSTVMEVLTACIREHSNQPLHEPTAEPGRHEPEPVTRPDIQAAVTVIGRRDTKYDRRRINLRQVHLPGADLPGANLADADLTSVNLTSAVLSEADLTSADLTGAKLSYAKLRSTKLTGANLAYALLRGADLTNAKLDNANLREADLRDAKLHRANLTAAKLTGAILAKAELTSADLTGADLTVASLDNPFNDEVQRMEANLTEADLCGAKLRSANLTGAKLRSAELTGADLTGADLTGADLTGADLTGAVWPTDMGVPKGWRRRTDSGSLERSDTHPGEPSAS
jgi:uncharacterized protein YjbI with pentapeptide repeats